MAENNCCLLTADLNSQGECGCAFVVYVCVLASPASLHLCALAHYGA